MKIDKVMREKIMAANEKARNVAVVPCCYEELEGEYIDYDAVANDPETFIGHVTAIGVPAAEDIIDVESYTPDGTPMKSLRAVAVP